MSSENPLKEYRKVKLMEREKTLSATSSIAGDSGSIRTIHSMSSLNDNGSGTMSSVGGSECVNGSTSSARSIKGPSANKAAANAVGRGLGKVGMALTKGAIDLPRAMADGLHNVPALYGDKVRNYGEIRGWKSGAVVGAKVCPSPFSRTRPFMKMWNGRIKYQTNDSKQSLGYGFYDGYVGFLSQPYKGARDEGALGLMKGVVKGSMGLLTQPGHAIFGVVAYPALGLYKQLNTRNLNGTQKMIMEALREYGIWFVQKGSVDREEVMWVVKKFEDEWLRVRE
jgi:sterol 3beta-glucosyltransferase